MRRTEALQSVRMITVPAIEGGRLWVSMKRSNGTAVCGFMDHQARHPQLHWHCIGCRSESNVSCRKQRASAGATTTRAARSAARAMAGLNRRTPKEQTGNKRTIRVLHKPDKQLAADKQRTAVLRCGFAAPITRRASFCMRARAERCRSGRSGRSRKPLYPQGYRGFESLPLRQRVRMLPQTAASAATCTGSGREANRCPQSGQRARPSWSVR
jgi:hypothetical protein